MPRQKKQQLKSDMERIKNLSEEDIQRAALSDPDAQPTDEEFWLNATRVDFRGCKPEECLRQMELLAADPHEKEILDELAGMADTEDWTGGRPDEQVIIPGAVVDRMILGKVSRIHAWREHLGLTQEDVAKRMEVSRPAFAQMEAKGANVRPDTLKKIAMALGVEWEQLQD
jgi:DNA-binding XRE family transcriptional regulator